MDKIDQAIVATVRAIRNSAGDLVAFVPRIESVSIDHRPAEFSPEWFDDRRRRENERRA